MPREIKILAFTKYSRQGASSRLRTFQFRPYFEKSGLLMEIAPLFDDEYVLSFNAGKSVSLLYLIRRFFLRLSYLYRAKKYDIVWIEKELFPKCISIFELFLKFMRVKYIVDYDDAIFNKYETLKFPLRQIFTKKIPKVMRWAAGVTCGNTFLAMYSQEQGQRNTHLIPTVVDIHRYQVVQHGQKEIVTIGWIGSPSTAKYLELIQGELLTLSKEINIRIVTVGARFDLPGLKTEYVEWSENSETQVIQTFDIGVMPIDKSRWSSGKCGYKLIQYMASGIASIGTKWGANIDIIDQGIDGFLANSSTDWLEALRQLAGNSETRANMGKKAREKIESKYSLDIAAPRLIEIIKDAYQG